MNLKDAEDLVRAYMTWLDGALKRHWTLLPLLIAFQFVTGQRRIDLTVQLTTLMLVPQVWIQRRPLTSLGPVGYRQVYVALNFFCVCARLEYMDWCGPLPKAVYVGDPAAAPPEVLDLPVGPVTDKQGKQDQG